MKRGRVLDLEPFTLSKNLKPFHEARIQLIGNLTLLYHRSDFKVWIRI